MGKSCTVLYNGACPICAREIALYRAEAGMHAPHVAFADVTDPDASGIMAARGLTPDAAARRFHVVHNGRLLSGIDAFVALWSALPRWRWAARLVARGPVRAVAEALYDRAAAPTLYALHRRRQRRKVHGELVERRRIP